MADTATKIMAEVLYILAISTEWIEKGRTSKCLFRDMSPFTKPSSEQYLKKLVGNTEIENALKRLDKLTQEEARMATAQVLKVTHAVDDRARGVDNRVAGVDDKLGTMDDRVRAVDDKIAAVIDGARYTFDQSLKECLTQYA
jgi:hypothetical protein